VREYLQKSWPQATATVEGCSVDPYVPLRSASGTPVWHIQCRIGYRADSDEIGTSIRSRSTTSGWGGDAEGMRRWVANHHPGSQLIVHFDPSDHNTVVLTATDMPYAGPRTPDNLRLLLISSIACFGFLVIARRLQVEIAKLKDKLIEYRTAAVDVRLARLIRTWSRQGANEKQGRLLPLSHTGKCLEVSLPTYSDLKKSKIACFSCSDSELKRPITTFASEGSYQKD
jgi:hypothetical protein